MERIPITDDHTARALGLIAEGLAELRAGGFDRLPGTDVSAALIELESLGRQIRSAQIEMLAEAERRGLHTEDGHSSARIMVRHRCRLATAEAAHRARLIGARRDLPLVAAAYERGEIGTDQVNLVARVHANPRIQASPRAREALIGFQAEILTLATRHSYRDFELALARWESLIDEDGPEPRNSITHRNRDVAIVQDRFELAWRLRGQFAALQGSRLREILAHFAEVELERDWAEARARCGSEATMADLSRTDAQRRADALEHIFSRAASAPSAATPPPVVHTVVWNADTYFATLHRLECDGRDCGAEVHTRPNPWYDAATYRCETINGDPLEPVEAAVDSLRQQVQRIVINARGVVIDMGRTARLFTGSARRAVKLQHTTCIWPGCWVPSSACEADHLHPHARGGGTKPENGAPLCGRHNRWKQKGFTTYRDSAGRWRVVRPDGREVA